MFRNIPLIDIWKYLKTINYFWILPSIALVFLSCVVRVIRWRTIVQSIRKIDFLPLYHTTMIAFMMNCIFPGRIGGIAKPFILKKQGGVPLSIGISTIAVERLLDGFLLIIFFILTLEMVHIDPNFCINFNELTLNKDTLQSVGKNMFYLSIMLLIVVILTSLKTTRKLLILGIIWFPKLLFFIGAEHRKKIREKFCTKLVNFIENFASGFSMLKKTGKIVHCFALSIIMWALTAYSFFILSMGFSGISISLIEMWAMMIIINFFILLPSTPGFWGLWEAGGYFALSLFGITEKDAAGFILISHAIQFLTITMAGWYSAVLTRTSIFEKYNLPKSESNLIKY